MLQQNANHIQGPPGPLGYGAPEVDPLLSGDPGQQHPTPPVNPASAVSAPRSPDLPQAPPKPRILVVDDEAPIRDLLRELFARHGYEVSLAATAGEALGALDNSSIRLVILDISLEDADGLELLTTIRRAHPGLPVIMLTGMGYDSELENEALQRGAQGYVSKTLPPDQLLMEIHRVLRHAGGEDHTLSDAPQN